MDLAPFDGVQQGADASAVTQHVFGHPASGLEAVALPTLERHGGDLGRFERGQRLRRGLLQRPCHGGSQQLAKSSTHLLERAAAQGANRQHASLGGKRGIRGFPQGRVHEIRQQKEAGRLRGSLLHGGRAVAQHAPKQLLDRAAL